MVSFLLLLKQILRALTRTYSWSSAISNGMMREDILIVKRDFTQFPMMRAKGKPLTLLLFLNSRYLQF